jgi:hypothetical protein
MLTGFSSPLEPSRAETVLVHGCGQRPPDQTTRRNPQPADRGGWPARTRTPGADLTSSSTRRVCLGDGASSLGNHRMVRRDRLRRGRRRLATRSRHQAAIGRMLWIPMTSGETASWWSSQRAAGGPARSANTIRLPAGGAAAGRTTRNGADHGHGADDGHRADHDNRPADLLVRRLCLGRGVTKPLHCRLMQICGAQARRGLQP